MRPAAGQARRSLSGEARHDVAILTAGAAHACCNRFARVEGDESHSDCRVCPGGACSCSTGRRRSTSSQNTRPKLRVRAPSLSPSLRPSSRSFPPHLGEGARRLVGSAREDGVRPALRVSRGVPGPAADRLGEIAREHSAWHEVDSTRNGATRAPLPRPGRLARPRASQAHPHEPRAARLKTGRWGRVASARDAARTYRRPHLLGELHAACPVLAVRVRRGDLPRVHRRRRGRMAGDPRAHRPLTPNQSS